MSRIKLWTKMSSEELWQTWRSNFASDDEAIAEAIWRANRLVKDKAPSTKRGFYDIKDEFIERHAPAGTGQRVRLEGKPCWGCDGQGCMRCGDTGLYRARWLYVHRFQIAGRDYCFHSYTKPAHLLDGTGEDKESYGGRFTEEEWKQMELPVSGLKKALHHVAISLWGMDHHQGRYFNYADLPPNRPEDFHSPDGWDDEECPF